MCVAHATKDCKMSHGKMSEAYALQTWRYNISCFKDYIVVCYETGYYLLWWRTDKQEGWRTDTAEVGIQCNMDEKVAGGAASDCRSHSLTTIDYP